MMEGLTHFSFNEKRMYGTVYEFKHHTFKKKIWSQVTFSNRKREMEVEYAELSLFGSLIHTVKKVKSVSELENEHIPAWLLENIKKLEEAI